MGRAETHQEAGAVDMVSFYKWLVAALTSVVLVFGSYYIKGVESDTERAYKSVETATDRLMEHEQRITTLEESKRNTEQILQEIKSSIQRIENAIAGRPR